MISLNGGSNPTTVTFNGNDCNEVWYNGVLVWQKKIDVTPSTDSYYNGYWELNYPNAGEFHSDTTDFKLNFGSSVVNNPLTLVDVEVNYGTYSTSISNFRLKYSWQREDEEGGIGVINKYVVYKSNTVTPTISVINDGTGKLAYSEGVIYAVKSRILKDYVTTLKLFPSVINSATYTTNLADYLAYWNVCCRNVDHSDSGEPTLSEKPQYSNLLQIGSGTGYTGALYVALPDEPPFEEYTTEGHTDDPWTCTVDWTGTGSSAYITQNIAGIRFKFSDSNGKTWYTSWITSGIGYGYPAFEIYPA